MKGAALKDNDKNFASLRKKFHSLINNYVTGELINSCYYNFFTNLLAEFTLKPWIMTSKSNSDLTSEVSLFKVQIFPSL